MKAELDSLSLTGAAADYLEGLLEGFVAYDAAWRLAYVNAAGERILGRRRDELLGKTWHQAFPHARGNEIDAMYQRVMRSRVAERLETFYAHYGRWMEISASPVRSGGIGVYFRDATERNVAERTLRESEKQLRFVTDHAPALIVHCDAESRYRFVNAPYTERFGLAREAVIGRTITEVLGAEVYARLRPHIEAALRGERVEFEAEIPYRDIGAHWMRCVYVPQVAADGRIEGFVGVIHDVGERRGAEAALRESEQRLRLALEAGRMGNWEWDIPAGKVSWSPSLEALHGLAAGTFPGTFEAYQSDIHPDDRDHVQRAVGETLAGRDHHIEYRIVLPDGAERWVEGRGKLMRGEDGRPLRMIGVCTDITERKRAEQALRESARQQQAIARIGELALRERSLQKLFDHATAALAETLQIEYCKVLELLPGGGELLLRAGVGWQAGLVGKATVGAGRDSQAGFTLLSDAPVIVADLRAETRFDGPPLLFEHGVVSGMSCVILAPGGRPWGVLGAHTARARRFSADDVAFLVAAANILGEAIHRDGAEQALKEADRRKDEFLATLSHELRNPLAPLRNGLQLLELCGRADPRIEPIRALMDRQVNHLVRLVDDLLEVSRISRGSFELRRERVELAAVVRNAVETSEPLIRAARHELSVALPGEALWIDGDPVRLAQIIANLLNNAAKYTDPGGRIALRASAGEGRVQVAVCDNGNGIDAEVLPRLFEMFTRGGGIDRSGQGGLGIGLALARRLAQMHGGTLSAASEGAGRGAEFTLTLPLAAAPEAPMRAAQAAQRIAPRRVLVVDDNRDAAQSLGMVLQFLGADVQIAYDGRQAIDALESYEPGVVFLDVGMPGMDGYEVARRIRARRPARTPAIIALTGWGQEEDRRRAREAGFDHHLVKPADMGAIQALLASL